MTDAELLRLLAERERECPGDIAVWRRHEDVDNEYSPLVASRESLATHRGIGLGWGEVPELETCACDGSGKVPLLPVLRQVCPCIQAAEDSYCEGCWGYLGADGPAGVNEARFEERCFPGCACHGLGWVVNEGADTGAILDGLKEAGYGYSVDDVGASLSVSVIRYTPKEGPFPGVAATARHAVLLAAEAATREEK
jgi:hypothetical protein